MLRRDGTFVRTKEGWGGVGWSEVISCRAETRGRVHSFGRDFGYKYLQDIYISRGLGGYYRSGMH